MISKAAPKQENKWWNINNQDIIKIHVLILGYILLKFSKNSYKSQWLGFFSILNFQLCVWIWFESRFSITCSSTWFLGVEFMTCIENKQKEH